MFDSSWETRALDRKLSSMSNNLATSSDIRELKEEIRQLKHELQRQKIEEEHRRESRKTTLWAYIMVFSSLFFYGMILIQKK
jgi:uncharacterized small protein (DUF1192 family)